MRHSRTSLVLGASMGFLGAGTSFFQAALGQCTPEWLPTASIPGVTGEGSVNCATTWDPDGAGPAEPLLVIGGGFVAAGNVLTGGLAAWDGSAWSSLNGPAAEVLATYDGDLIAGGFFLTAGGVPAQRIARYDGTAWHALGAGLNQTVRALAVYNGELIAAGFFTDAGGNSAADYIARWNGTSWQPLGTGVNDVVTALTVHNGELFVGGGFSTAGGQPADNVARWNGSGWQGLNDSHDVINVHALHVFQGELIAAGTFIPAGTGSMDFVVRWTGTAWQELGGGTNDHIFDFCEYQGELICGGLLTNAGGTSAFHLAKWNGSFWSPVFPMVGVGALTEYRGDLIVGGRGLKANMEPMSLVLRWDGVSAGYVGRGTDGAIFDFETYQGVLYAGGEFGMIGNAVAAGIARWVGGEWQAVGAGAGGIVQDMVVFDGDLIASGTFGTSGWDGQTWQPHGFTPVNGMHVYNGDLYGAIGFQGPNLVGRWNPSTTAWDVVGKFPEQVFVALLTTYNGELIAGGFGNGANVWRFDEGSWVPVGGSMGLGSVRSFAVYNGELVAGGYFPGTFTNILNGLARFNGTDWTPIGGGVMQGGSEWSHFVGDVMVHDGSLIVTGGFTHAGPSSLEVNNIASWNGTSWSALGSGLRDAALCLHSYDGDVHIGGYFHLAGGKPAGHWARWGCEASGCYPDCNADSQLTIADFGCFQTRFVAADPYADCNASGSLTIADFGCFQSAFVGGCP